VYARELLDVFLQKINHMKSPFLIFIAAWLVLSACTNYQYVQLHTDKLNKNKNDKFYFKDDHLLITYQFNGRCTPVIMEIENIGDEAVKIDWTKSAVISNEMSRSYYDREGTFESRPHMTLPSSYSGEISFKVSESFLPPTSKMIKTSRYNYCPELESSRFEKARKTNDNEVGIKGKRLTFTKEASPLIMENYVTYSVSDSGDDVRVLRHSFYVNELIASRSRPSDVEPSSNYSYNGEVDLSGFFVFSMVSIAFGFLLLITGV